LIVAVLCGTPLLSVAAQRIERPELPAGADRNDWAAYYDLGIDNLRNSPSTAANAFTWAARLDPSRSEPLYASWIAFWARDADKFAKYLRDDEKIIRDPAVLRADSLRLRALRRNPFVHQGLVVLLYDLLPGRWPDDMLTRAWVAYGNAELPLALELFGRAVERDPKKYGYLRYNRASAFVNLGKVDSASAEIASLLAQLRAQDNAKVGDGYQSKEQMEYAEGLIQLTLRHSADARQAFARALLENPGFAPAHAMIGDLASAAGDTATALLEYQTAIEVDPNDVILRLGYGKTLIAARRPADAVVQFRQAVTMAPEYAEAYRRLGTALETAGDAVLAGKAYTEFLARAPRKDPARAQVSRRLEALGKTP
jgi:Tfp pilus assembly protein PilF